MDSDIEVCDREAEISEFADGPTLFHACNDDEAGHLGPHKCACGFTWDDEVTC